MVRIIAAFNWFVSQLSVGLERCYFSADFLRYSQFEVRITAVDDVRIEYEFNAGKQTHERKYEPSLSQITVYDFNTNEHLFTISADVLCVDTGAASYVVATSLEPTFFQCVEKELNRQSYSTALTFETVSAEVVIVSLDTFDYVLYGLLSFMFTMSVVALWANLFNSKKVPVIAKLHCVPVDNGDFMAVIVYGLQIWDLTSDLNLVRIANKKMDFFF